MSFLRSTVTGRRLPAGCCRVTCAACAGVHTRRLDRAMRRAAPAQLVTLTLIGDDWQTIRARVARIRHRVSKAVGDGVDWAWTVERNPKGTGHHVHAAKRGTFLSHGLLAQACAREGAGFPWVSHAHDAPAPERYLTKYLNKGAGEWSDFLALNGGRFVHTSRGFWRDDFGMPATWRQARRGDGTWVLERYPAGSP